MEVILLRHPTEEDWYGVKLRALVTMGKNVTTPPTDEWKHKMLRARHSPIRHLQFSFYLKDVPSWVSVHLVRHVHAQPYVKSLRNDRQSEFDRNAARQDTPVDMIYDVNAEEFLTICNKRLCYKASKETRDVVYEMTRLVAESNPEFVPFMVPMCFHMNMSCPEFDPCGMYNVRILNWKVDEAEDIRK